MDDEAIDLVGYRFLPTEEELPCHYLRDKVFHPQQDFDFIVDRDVYDAEPWALFGDKDPWNVEENTGGGKTLRRILYAFTKINSIGKKRKAQSAGHCSWHGSTGKRNVFKDSRLIGTMSYLTFKPCCKDNDEAEASRRTHGHWRMHDFRLAGESLEGVEGYPKFAVCRITMNSRNPPPPPNLTEEPFYYPSSHEANNGTVDASPASVLDVRTVIKESKGQIPPVPGVVEEMAGHIIPAPTRSTAVNFVADPVPKKISPRFTSTFHHSTIHRLRSSVAFDAAMIFARFTNFKTSSSTRTWFGFNLRS